MAGVCELTRLEARLDHKLKALAKHHKIVESLKEDVRMIETQKSFYYFQMMNGKGVY